MQTDSDKPTLWEDELKQIDRRFADIDRDQQQFLQLALRGFPEDTVEKENEKINNYRSQLHARKDELTGEIEQFKQSDIDAIKIEKFCQIATENLKGFTSENKRLALDTLQVQVVVDGEKITLSRAIPIVDIVTALPY